MRNTIVLLNPTEHPVHDTSISDQKLFYYILLYSIVIAISRSILVLVVESVWFTSVARRVWNITRGEYRFASGN